MDYNSYRAMCEASLEHIKRSENKRQELDHKLQKMYQEKSECEKSIIKTLQNQQKQSMDEKRQRAERNGNILRTLERIDSQATALAAKTERLKALKKQYEKYLLSLWNRKRQMTYHGASKYDRFMTQQSPYVESKYHSFDNPTFQSSSPYINVIPPSMNYHHNQSYLREVPSPADNSIKTSNYQTTGVGDIQQKFPYPNMLQVRHDDFTQASGYQQISAERKPFDHDGKDISNEYLNSQTINPIYSQQPFTMFDEKSSTKAFHPIYQQQNNQPLQSCNYSQESLKLSKPFYDTPLILPAASSALLVTQLSPKSTRGMLSAPSDEILLKSHPENMQNSTTNVHMSDGDEETESDGEKRNAGKRNIRRNDLIASGMMHHQQQGDEGKVNIGSHQKLSDINTGIKINEFQNSNDVNETIGNENMHQIWEKIIEASPVDAQNSSNFVIPKIIVETQIDLTTAAPKMLLKQTVNEHQGDFYEKQDGDTPEKLLNHSKDDQQNESLSLQPQQESKVNNNSPLEQTGLTIYHNDKQPFSDEQQKYRSENRHHQQHPTSSIEHELRDFDRIQITDKEDAATRIMTYESEIKTNNSMAEGTSDDIVGSEEGTKAINNGNEASAVSLNDKINEIYRKIEKIEGDYYDGKGKIIEISERRMSSSSLNDSARIETLSINDSPDIRNDEAKVNSPQNIQQLETFHENIQRPVSIENNIYETDENEWPEASNGNEIKSQETSKADYNYENFVADENQQNFIPSQAYDDALTTENDYTSTLQAYQNQGEFGQVQQFENQYDASDVQTNNAIYDNAQYSYDSTQQNYENFVDPQQNQQQQQQESEYVYSHHDNTQQQDENSFNPSHSQQLDSNYQHGNYDDAQEISSNYTNDFDAGVYYDYDQSQQQQQQPQTYYDDPNYSHEQSEEYQEQTPQLYYENIDNNKVEMNQEQPNDDNFEYSENIAYNLSSDENHSQQIIETPQTDIYNISNSDMNVYESQPTSEMMPLETVNYEQIPEQNYENVAKMSAVGDESTTNMTSLSEASNPLNNINSEREKDFNDSNRPSKKDDIKLMKQLLDSESDDTTTRSNLLKTSIKEETDESDFDISAS